MKSNKYEIDMCNGSIMDKLISFSMPLMLSGILQLMFNAVDIIVVGQFAGSESLAAVGSTTALIAVFTNLFIGISLGANVLAARFYASGKHKEMSETVHTAITLALVSGIIMAFVGLIFSRLALEIMGTPDNVIEHSTLYMRIYFLGMPFFMLYNYGAAISEGSGRYQASVVLSDHIRGCKCVSEPASGHCLSYGSGWCCNRNCSFPVYFLYFGTALSVSFGGKLPASFL